MRVERDPTGATRDLELVAGRGGPRPRNDKPIVHGSGIYQALEDASSAILTKPGDVNHLLVRSMDNNYIFVVNGTVVDQMSADFSDGEVGLGVDATDKGNSAQVQFTNFEVHAPPP